MTGSKQQRNEFVIRKASELCLSFVDITNNASCHYQFESDFSQN